MITKGSGELGVVRVLLSDVKGGNREGSPFFVLSGRASSRASPLPQWCDVRSSIVGACSRWVSGRRDLSGWPRQQMPNPDLDPIGLQLPHARFDLELATGDPAVMTQVLQPRFLEEEFDP